MRTRYRIKNAAGQFLSGQFSNGRNVPVWVKSPALAYTYDDKTEAARLADAFLATVEATGGQARG